MGTQRRPALPPAVRAVRNRTRGADAHVGAVLPACGCGQWRRPDEQPSLDHASFRRISVSGARRIVQTAPLPEWAVRAYDDLHGRDVNFSPIAWEDAAADPRWQVDRERTDLPAEAPGPPRPGGPFETACDLLRRYEVADPALVRAVYDAAAPFDGRDMLLVGRFLGLRFPMGVRVGGVFDGRDEVDQVPVHRFAWHYRTLEGHLERGQMDYEVVKYLEDGRVEFRIAAYSQRGPIQNPIVRAGFALFGRPTQKRFYARAMRRMRTMTAERVGDGPHPSGA
ncbi:MAG: DUF1990 family protein [Nitriliruptor sp.]|nr:MAG: DUF1990 family protein [Nitriliruptor sp.]